MYLYLFLHLMSRNKKLIQKKQSYLFVFKSCIKKQLTISDYILMMPF